MKVEEVLNKAKIAPEDIVQFLDSKRFAEFLCNEDSLWNDFVASEIFTCENRDLTGSKFYAEKIASLDVDFSYRKKFDDHNGIALVVKVSDENMKKLRKEARSNVILSGYSLSGERR